MSLTEIVQHPHIQSRFNVQHFEARGRLGGVDYVVGLVKDALDEHPDDEQLRQNYLLQQREYPRLFRSTPQMTEPKNPGYKAANGF